MKHLLFSVLFVCLGSKAFAHFQMLYTPDFALDKGKSIEIRHIFTHPFEDKQTLNMGEQHDTKVLAPIEEFYVINKRKKTPLSTKLQSIKFQGNTNKGHAYSMKYKARKMGDHVFILKPAPFYDKTQDMYIQQTVKSIVNIAGAPTNWDKTIGLNTEIIPLVKPYAIWEGSNFTGIVTAQGKAVPYASIDITYLNRDINLQNNSMGKDKIKAPNKVFSTLTIKANQNGEFTFTIPKAGFWGFCATNLIQNKHYKNKKLRQDALIWVQAKSME
jgi:cobalt/nickel transport protein